MITPNDIQGKEFTKVMRGYSCEEVDTFLDMITLDLEQIIKEKEELEASAGELQKHVDASEETDSEAAKVLRQAQDMMADIQASADKRAELIIHNAELEAETILREAKEKAASLEAENRRLEQAVENFRTRYRDLLSDEMRKLGEPAAPAAPEPEVENVTSLEDLFNDFDMYQGRSSDTLSNPTIISSSIPDSPQLEEDGAKNTMVINLGEDQ